MVGEGDWLMESLYWLLLLGIVMCSFLGFFIIVKARRRRELAYYLAGGVCFLVVVAFVAVLFEQWLLFFALMGVAFIISVGALPRVVELYGEEIVKQKQETDASAPLRMRDFLTWKAWIKLEAIYGLNKMIILYAILNIGLVAVGLLTLIVLDLVTPIAAVSYTISTTLFFLTIGYRQLRKALKNS
jgi:hypothetical protein